ncbi:MAG TPA: ATP-binding protein [Rhodocyclaceae bacterium]
MPLFPRRLKGRVVLLVSCVLLATGVASGWLSASRQTAGLLNAMTANSTVIVRNFAETIARDLLVEDYAALEAFLLRSVRLPDVRRLQVFEPDGALVWDVARSGGAQPTARTGIERQPVPATRAPQVAIEGDRLVVWQPIEAAHLLGWIRADLSLSAIRAAQARAWEHSLLLATAWMACSALLILLILRPIVHSIGQLSGFARRLAERKGEQVALAGHPAAEILELGDSLNEASARLAAAERQLLDDRERLQRSEEKYRTIFEESFDGLFITTPAGRIADINKKGLAMLGYASTEEVARLDLERDIYAYPPDRRRILAMVEAHGTAEYEVMVKRRDGSSFVAHCALTAVRDAAGAVASYRGIIRDVTQAKRAEAEIRKLNEELEQRVAERTAQLESANKELEAFSYSVSHDLRAPLRHIDGFIHILRDDIEATLGPDDRHYMEVISRAARQMEKLIDDLLAFSRIGRSELRKAPVDLGAMVAELLQELEPDIQGRRIEWRIAALPVVTGDRTLLRVALSNLVLNAIKFTRQRDPAVIEIGWQPGDREDAIFVRDNGAGFDMTYADRLFGVFQRLHRAEDFEGTGIGLANVRRVIARHGGRTWAEGQVGAGATFYFSLPRPAQGEETAA